MTDLASVVLMLTTVASEEDAERLSRLLVDQQLAACVTRTQVASVYRWDGAVQSDSEFQLVIKTMEKLRPAVERAVLERHPYDLPELVVVPAEASDAYGAWVAASVS